MLRDSGWGVLGIARGRHDRGQGKRQGRKYGRIEGDKVKAGDGGGSRSRRRTDGHKKDWRVWCGSGAAGIRVILTLGTESELVLRFEIRTE